MRKQLQLYGKTTKKLDGWLRKNYMINDDMLIIMKYGMQLCYRSLYPPKLIITNPIILMMDV